MTALGIMAAIAALLALAVWAGLLPPVRVAGRDWNNMTGIEMLPPDHPKFLSEPREAVLAQELAEWLLKWLLALALAAPAVWALDLFGVAVAAPLAVILAYPLAAKTAGERQIELVGHAVEIMAAERLGAGADYARTEARRMVLGYRAFEGQGFDEVLAAMARRRWLARLLLEVVWRRARRGK